MAGPLSPRLQLDPRCAVGGRRCGPRRAVPPSRPALGSHPPADLRELAQDLRRDRVADPVDGDERQDVVHPAVRLRRRRRQLTAGASRSPMLGGAAGSAPPSALGHGPCRQIRLATLTAQGLSRTRRRGRRRPNLLGSSATATAPRSWGPSAAPDGLGVRAVGGNRSPRIGGSPEVAAAPEPGPVGSDGGAWACGAGVPHASLG